MPIRYVHFRRPFPDLPAKIRCYLTQYHVIERLFDSNIAHIFLTFKRRFEGFIK